MSQIEQLKEAIENISKKKHVLSSEATYAKEVINSKKDSDQEDIKHNLEKQQNLMKEFNTSIALLMKVFKQSRFDEVMGLIAEPYKLILINSLIGFFRGMFFGLGLIVVVTLIAYVFKFNFIG